MNFVELDANTKLAHQFREAVEPLVVVNRFVVAPEDDVQFLTAWRQDRDWFSQQPGFVSARLIKGVAGSRTYMNFAEWQSSADFRAAVSKPEVRAFTAKYPANVIESLHLFCDA